MKLSDHLDRAVLKDRAGGKRGNLTEVATTSGKEGEELVQDFIGRDIRRGASDGHGQGLGFH